MADKEHKAAFVYCLWISQDIRSSVFLKSKCGCARRETKKFEKRSKLGSGC